MTFEYFKKNEINLHRTNFVTTEGINMKSLAGWSQILSPFSARLYITGKPPGEKSPWPDTPARVKVPSALPPKKWRSGCWSSTPGALWSHLHIWISSLHSGSVLSCLWCYVGNITKGPEKWSIASPGRDWEKAASSELSSVHSQVGVVQGKPKRDVLPGDSVWGAAPWEGE